jgi:hypothetical protein
LRRYTVVLALLAAVGAAVNQVFLGGAGFGDIGRDRWAAGGGGVVDGRGLHSSTSQLNSSRV